MTTIENTMTTSFPSENTMIATHDKDKYVVVLPCWGAPYIHGIYKHNGTTGDNLKLLQDAVMGDIEAYDRKQFVIHPLFAAENPRWNIARQFLTSQYTKVYVNDDGIAKCGVNTGTVITNPMMRVGGCPHLCGDVALVVPKKVFDVICGDARKMTLYKNPLTSGKGENGCWEFEDDEDTEKHTKHFDEKGYDFNEDNGFCYLAKF